MNEEEYIAKAAPIYQKALIIGELKNKVLKLQFIDENPTISDKEFQNEFEKYFASYKESLFENANLDYVK